MLLQNLKLKLFVPFAKRRSRPDLHLLARVNQDIPPSFIKASKEQAFDGATTGVAPAE
tara:strand:+ start:113 stop:286 length:174 start_codon:yes stop_codon:yes gene_type:complete